MKEHLKLFRFWLAGMFFERWLKWPSATEKAKKIEGEVNKNNKSKYSQSHCYSCGSKNLRSKITGSDGPFCSPHHFYECKDCGNNQERDGSSHQYLFLELRKARIVSDQDKYRYAFNPKGTANTIGGLCIIMIMILGMTPLALCILSFAFNIGPFAH